MKKDNEWGFYTLPTQTDPEKRAIERLKIASELSLEHYGTPQTREDARKLDDGRYRARCIPLVDGGGRAARSNELI